MSTPDGSSGDEATSPVLPARSPRPLLVATAVFVTIASVGAALLLLAHDRARIVERSRLVEQAWTALGDVERNVEQMLDLANSLARSAPLPEGERGAARIGEVADEMEGSFDGALVLRGDDVLASLGTSWVGPEGDPDRREGVAFRRFSKCAATGNDADLSSRAPAAPLTSMLPGAERVLIACAVVSDGPGEWRERDRAIVWASSRRLARESALSDLSELGVDYELFVHYLKHGGRRPELLARSNATTLQQPVEFEASVGGVSLLLRAAPREGGRRVGAMVTVSLCILLFGLAGAALAHDLSRRPETLARTLAETSERLVDTEKALTREFKTRRDAEEELHRRGAEDRLTGLASRESLIARLQRCLDRMRGNEASEGALVLFGIDRFSAVNESFGHATGDELLRALPRRIRPAIPAGTDSVPVMARLGDDEFCVLLECVSGPEDALRVADRLRASFDAPFRLLDRDVFLISRVGITMVTTAYRRSEQVLRDASVALQRAKASRSADPVLFDEEMHRRALGLLELESDLRQALDTNELSLAFQPIVSLPAGTITGFEGLARWRHRERGMVSPVTFVPIAEEVGLVAALDRTTLKNGAMQLSKWHETFPATPPLKLSTNLSGNSLLEPGLVGFVEEVLHASGVPPSALHLEVTETVVVENAAAAERILGKLRELGVRLYLDDFGTGYSSLSYLRRFPFHCLKIDRAFVSRMTESPKDAEIVRAIVHMAHSLGMSVVAEGIETAEHLNELRELGCELGQGYFFSKPLFAKEIEALLRAAPRF